MTMMAETYVLQAVQNGLSAIQQNTSLLDDILDALSAAELTSAKNYFATAKIKVAPGFPMQQPDLPFIGVTVATADMDVTRSPIGWQGMVQNNGDGTSTNVQTTVFRGVIKSTIYTPNADLIVWLSEVVAWSLLSQASLFFDAQMGAVSISIGDYEPSPEFLPIFTFARGVTLSCVFEKTWTASPVSNVTSASVTVEEVNVSG